MAYLADKKPGELTALTSLATDDIFVVGDTSDASEVAKGITKANLITDLTTSFATAGHNHTGVYAPMLGADDNYVTDAEKAALHSHSNKTVLDNTTASFTTAQETKLGGIEALADVTDAANVGSVNAAAASKTTPVDADSVVIVNSESANAIGRSTFTNVKAFLKTYFDTLYLTSANVSDTAYGVGWNGVTTTAPSKNAVYDEIELRAPKASPSFTGTVTLPTGLTGVLRADSGVVSTDSDVTDIVSAASDTAAGKVELATTAETNTGTDTGRAVTPDGLAGSYAGTKSLSVQLFDGATDVTTGDGKAYITIPESLNGMNLIRAQATVVTAGTTNATTVMVHNKTDAQDMLSGAISIASGGTVGTVGTINTTYDDVSTNDILRVDIDSVSTTPPKGMCVVLEFRLP